MSVSGVTASSAYSAQQQSTREVKKTLGSEDFLKLLSVQLQNQDPMDPMDDTEFISQMANFSSLESMSKLSSNFESFSQNQQQMAAQSYLGKIVTVENEDGEEVKGQVSALTNNSKDGLVVTVEDKDYSVSDIRRVELTATTQTNGKASQ